MFAPDSFAFFSAVGNAINFDQHAGTVAEIAAHGRARGIGRRKMPGINLVVALEETGVAEVDVDLDHIAKGGTFCLENGGNIGDGLFGLLLNVVANQLPGPGSMGPVPLTNKKSPARHPWE